MRIAYLAYTPMPSRKASGVNIMKMCQAFAELGHHVTLFNPRFDPAVSSRELASHYGITENFTLRALPRPRDRIKGLLRYARSYRRMIYRWKPDLLYIRDQGAKVYVPCNFRISKVFEAHLLHPGNPHIETLARDPFLRRFVVISAALGDDYAQAYPSLAPKLAIHHDGADPMGSQAGMSRNLIATRPGKLNAAYIGNLYPGKGMEMIVRLLPLAPFCHFHIIGGQESDLEYWRALCADSQNISFHGYWTPAEVESMRTSFDCLLAPFQSRVMVGPVTDAARWMSPLKIFEYMAAGRPIVASDLPVIREILRDGVNAMLCSADDPQEWLRALQRLHATPEIGLAIASAAKRDLITRYTWRVRAERILRE